MFCKYILGLVGTQILLKRACLYSGSQDINQQAGKMSL